MKKALLSLILLSFTLFACSVPQSKKQAISIPSAIVPFYDQAPLDIKVTAKKEPRKVGMLLPLSGKSAKLADDLRNAGILAQFELASDNFILSFYDTKGTEDGAKEAFEQAMQGQEQIILGPVFATEVGAIKRSAQWLNIPVVSFTSDADKLGKGVYSLALTIPNQTERIIRFACEQGKKRLAIIAPDNKAGDLAISTAQKTADSCGMEVTKLSVYNPTFVNFEPYVASVLPENFVDRHKEKMAEKKKARVEHHLKKDIDAPQTQAEEAPEEQLPELTIAEQLDFDALFIADDGNRLKSISSLFGLYDVTPDDVMFLGLSTWNEPSLSNEGSLKNAYFPLLAQDGFEVFAKKFKETYGKKPNRLASLAYDAVALAIVMPLDSDQRDTVLTTPAGFLGTDGLFRFQKNGTAERLMSIYKILGPKHFMRFEKPSSTFEIEDWKKEQLSDIRLVNDAIVRDEPVEYVFESGDSTDKATPSLDADVNVQNTASQANSAPSASLPSIGQ